MFPSRLFCLPLALAVALSGCGYEEPADSTDELAVTEDDLAATGKFVTFTGADGKHYFNLVSTNSKIVLHSQGYAGPSSVNAGIASVLENGRLKTSYSINTANDGQFYFVLRAGNNRVIGTSETYSTRSNATRGIATASAIIKRLAP